MKVIWVPPINGQAKTMFPPEYTSSDPIPKHTNSFGCLNNNIILFSGLDESGNEKRPAQTGAGAGIIRDGLGAYGERILGSSFEYVQSNVSLYSLGSWEAPLFDIVAYAGYAFTGMCVPVMGRIMWSYSYYFLMPFMCMHGGLLGEDREENSICRDKDL
ncbi:hypothetical protein IFM89_013926 [Coptis chinensis]|uniref:Uncharacterized protein n=1 Tax=Coptis chinensis TaxID=261450 RepID=A0A835HHC2_9MAGN|nr:hypothetical protein IFM89_013926 [Coptis chinensis]